MQKTSFLNSEAGRSLRLVSDAGYLPVLWPVISGFTYGSKINPAASEVILLFKPLTSDYSVTNWICECRGVPLYKQVP